MHVIEHSIMIQEVDKSLQFYNQIKGKIINGYFKDGFIDWVESVGNSESIYYIKDENEAYIGMNRSEADDITIFFYDSVVKKIKFNTAVKGTTYPVKQIPEEDKLFKNFNWQETKRPKNKQELFLK
jgi:hypothetical protein